MNKAQENFKVLGSLLILIFLLCLGAWTLWYVVGLFNSLEPPVEAAIITAFVGFTSLIISNIYTSQREINLKLREKKLKYIQNSLNLGYKLCSILA